MQVGGPWDVDAKDRGLYPRAVWVVEGRHGNNRARRRHAVSHQTSPESGQHKRLVTTYEHSTARQQMPCR